MIFDRAGDSRPTRQKTDARCGGSAGAPRTAHKFPAVRYSVLLNLMLTAGFLLVAGFPSPAHAERVFFKSAYIIPEDVRTKGISFAGEKIPLDRFEVADRVAEQINLLLMDRRATMMAWFDRTAEFGPQIVSVLKDEKMPADFLYLPALLSNFLPNYQSRSGGVGWWSIGSVRQRKGSAVSQWLVTNDWDDRRDPILSTRIACRILQWLKSREHTDNWLLAVCGYVDGAENVESAVKKAPGYSYWDLVLPSKSESIIPRLVALKIIDTHRELYGVDVKTPPPLKYDFLGRVKLKKDLPLRVVAQWCGIDARAMWTLNPGVDPSVGILPKADARSPNGYPLRVPDGWGAKVKQRLIKEGYLET